MPRSPGKFLWKAENEGEIQQLSNSEELSLWNFIIYVFRVQLLLIQLEEITGEDKKGNQLLHHC